MVRLNVVLFCRDLRTEDQAALRAAILSDLPLLCLYCLSAEKKPFKGGQRWLPGALHRLSESLQKMGLPLYIFYGKAEQAIKILLKEGPLQLVAIYGSLPTEPAEAEQKKQMSREADKKNIPCYFPESSRLHPVSLSVLNGKAQPFRVFKAFYRAFERTLSENKLPELQSCPPVTDAQQKPLHLPEDFVPFSRLRLSLPDDDFTSFWTSYGNSAAGVLEKFLSARALYYERFRNYFGVGDSSMLSPYIAWGEISVRQIVQLMGGYVAVQQDFPEFWRQLVWREFAAATFHHNPQMIHSPLRPKWKKTTESEPVKEAWLSGNTGFPLIDAGMRQLTAVGWMPNRVRMVVASFLVKNLLQDWVFGADVFMEKLVDADSANNFFGWQWCAGCGYDAAPFFRIFNPEKQQKEYDPQGVYVKKWCKYEQGLISPIVDYALSRKRALEHYASGR